MRNSLCEHKLPGLLGKYIGEEWLNHMVGIFNFFKKTAKLFSKVGGLHVHGRHLLTFAFAARDLFNSWCDKAVSTDEKGECLESQTGFLLLLHRILSLI